LRQLLGDGLGFAETDPVPPEDGSGVVDGVPEPSMPPVGGEDADEDG